jgi:Cu(I)/Ag(I) efflux system membrane protein CusA/SilA
MADDPATDEYAPRGFWEHLIGLLISNRVVVAIGITLLVFAGLAVAPFRWDLGSLPRDPIPVDALPDISENQQIVFTKWPGRSPRDVEDQVTYPLTAALLGIPGVKTIRSSSVFGFSSIYVVFEDDVEFYWSRSRILEKLASLPAGTLPTGVSPTLGPDATALGQVFWYTVEARTEDGQPVAAFDADELRAVQDFQIRYALQSIPGVAEVSSIGGMVREYQVDVDPEAMLAAGISIGKVARAVQRGNLDVGARTVEINRAEYVVRGLGFVENTTDLEEVVIETRDNTPIRVKDVAKVALGPAQRRGLLDVGGAEAVGGIVVARFGDNPMAIIERVREKLEEIAPGLPERQLEDGRMAKVQVVPFYDRAQLIEETLSTLSDALIQQVLVTAMVVLVMLRRFRASILISILLPGGVLGALGLMKVTGLDANVMALAGIAIAIGTMVDLGIVFTENITQHLDRDDDGIPRDVVVRRAAAEVAPAVATSVLTTIIGFLPILGLTESEGRLFTPLAWTKTFALLSALLLAVVVIPAFAGLVLRPRRAKAPAVPGVQAIGRIDAIFAWVLLLGGLALVGEGHVGLGLLVAVVAAIDLGLPSVAARWRPWVDLGRNVLLIAVASWALAVYWLPLGPGASDPANFGFVLIAAAAVLGPFALFRRFYEPLLRWCLANKGTFLLLPSLLVALGLTIWLGAERVLPGNSGQRLADAMPGMQRDFMPAFDEGAFLYMPTTSPHASVGQAREMMLSIDAMISDIPEVERAVGKLGRADSPLDPAPISMFETLITYLPEYAHDEHGEIGRFAFDEETETHLRDEAGELIPDPEGRPYRQWRDHIHTPDDIWEEITKAASYPGVTGAPRLMPIQTRIVMLQSGMRSPIGIKLRGPDIETLERFGLQIEAILKNVEGLEASTVLADRIVGKPYLEIDIDRQAIGRYGLAVEDVQDVIQIAVGGKTLSQSVEGRERFPIRVRYMREERDSVEALARVMVPTPTGQQIPLEELAEIRYVRGPQMIRAEDTFLTAYVTFDAARGVGEVEAVDFARAALDEALASGELILPEGVSYRFAGTYENQLRSERRLMVLIPVALAIVFVLLYLQFRRLTTVASIYSGVIVAAAGGFLLLWLYQQPWFLDAAPLGVELRDLFNVSEYRMTVAVWVGFLALFGIATDDGVVMATYLDQRFRKQQPNAVADVRDAIVVAAKRRIRPCLMTTATTMLALLPVITSSGRGADLMIPMAIPVFGGMVVELITLFVVPVLWSLDREVRLLLRS